MDVFIFFPDRAGLANYSNVISLPVSMMPRQKLDFSLIVAYLFMSFEDFTLISYYSNLTKKTRHSLWLVTLLAKLTFGIPPAR